MDADIRAEIWKSLEGICSISEEDFLETYCTWHEQKLGEKFRFDPHQSSAQLFKDKGKRDSQREPIHTLSYRGFNITVGSFFSQRFGTLFRASNDYGEPIMDRLAHESLQMAVEAEKKILDSLIDV